MEHFATAWGFFGSFIVTGLIAAALAYPADCSYTDITGREVSCGQITNCGGPQAFGRPLTCNTVFGSPAFGDTKGQASAIAVVVSLVVAFILYLFGRRAQRQQEQQRDPSGPSSV